MPVKEDTECFRLNHNGRDATLQNFPHPKASFTYFHPTDICRRHHVRNEGYKDECGKIAASKLKI